MYKSGINMNYYLYKDRVGFKCKLVKCTNSRFGKMVYEIYRKSLKNYNKKNSYILVKKFLIFLF